MATLSVSSYSTTTISVSISGLVNPTSFYEGWRYSCGNGWMTGSGASYTFSGLSTGTSYSMYAQVLSKNIWYDAGSCSGHTSVPAPTISFDTKGSTWVQVITHTSETYGSMQTYVDGTPLSSTSYTYTRTGDYLLINGFAPLSTHTFYCTISKNGYSASSGTISVTTLAGRPPTFTWGTPKVSGGDFYVSASEWNAFANRINQFRVYKGVANYTFTTAVSGADFTAAMFNQARTALTGISQYFSSGNTLVAAQASGNVIYASYLNNLVSCLNSIT